jgi:hypothetical protein
MKIFKRWYKSLIISIGMLMISVVFSDLLHSVFNWALVTPIASTIKSGIWTDISFLGLTLLTGVSLYKIEFKKSGTGYGMEASVLAAISIYLFHRADGTRYQFSPFSFVHCFNYADLLVLLAIAYLTVVNWRARMQEQGNTNKTNRPAQSVIKNYLSQKTNHALLINGKRGTGKTYFMKNTIQPMINRTLIREEDLETYKTIFISLYGINKIDEIYFQLAINIKPYLKQLTVQSGSILAGILAKGLMNLSGVGSIEDYISDIKSATRKNIEASNFVVIFDDLDRMSGGLLINEFIGFVNSMVEHENNKVLIIADELQIEHKELYNAAREKSIGVIIDFRNDLQNSVKDIIKDRCKDKPKFRQALIDIEPDIFRVFNEWKCDNLRTFIFFLNHFQEIVNYIDTQNTKTDVRLLQLKDAAEYCALYSIEFSRGLISFSSPAGVDDPVRVNSYLSLKVQREMFKIMRERNQQSKTAEEATVKEAPYIETFAQHFSKKGHYYFYKSIFDFVTGGDELNTEILGQELKEEVTDRIFKPSDEELVYQKLRHPIVYDLSNNKYVELSEQLLQFAMEGKYPLARYNEIFHLLNRFPEIRSWSEKELSEQLIEAMHRNKDLYSHDAQVNFHRRHTDRSEYSAYEIAIDEAIVEVNNSIGIRDSEARKKNLFSVFSEDPEQFYQACYNDYVEKPVFNTWDFPSFLEVFQRLMPSQIVEFNQFLISRYGHMEQTSWVEHDFLSALYNTTTYSPEEGQPNTLRQFVLKNLSFILEEIVKKYYQLNPTR